MISTTDIFRLNLSWQKKIGLIPLFAFILIIGSVYLFNITEPIFDPPYFQFLLNAIFVFVVGISVAAISAKAYLSSGSINILLLGSAIFVSGLSSTVASWAVTLSANEAATIGNIGILVSSFIILISAVITLLGTTYGFSHRKTIFISVYSICLLTVAIIGLTASFNLLPDFLTPTGPTSIRLIILAVSIIFYIESSVMFGIRYWRLKSYVVYWYSLALALFSLSLIAEMLTTQIGDLINWVSRLALYLSGVYFLIALLSKKTKQDITLDISTYWANAFRLDSGQSEKLFTNMLNGFAYCKIETDSKGEPVNWIYLGVNSAYERIIGLRKEQVVGKRATDLFTEIQKERLIEKYGHVALNGKSTSFEMYREPIGKWLNISAYSPKKGYFVSIFEDITERKNALEALKQSEERLKRSQEIAHLGSWELDLINNRLSWSDEVYRIFGLKPQEFGATYEAFLNYVHPEDRSAVDCAYSGSILEGKESYEIEHRVVRKDTAEVRFVHERCTHIRDNSGQIIKSIGMVHDITERKQAEGDLRTSEEKFSKAFRNSPNAVTITRLSDGKIIDANNSVFDILGYVPSEVLGKTTFELNIWADQNDRNNLVKALATKGYVNDEEIDLIRKDRTKIRVTLSASLLEIQNQQCFLASFIDITARKKAEEAVKESEELFSKAFESSPSVLTITRVSDNRLINVNQSFLNLFGFARSEVIGKTSKELRLFPDYKSRQKIVNSVLNKGTLHNSEVLVQTKAGKVLNTLVSVETINIHGEKHLLVALVDLTEQKLLLKKVNAYTKNLERLVEERTKQLKNNERLAAIGATAGMVGHDIRNPLQAITGDLYLANTDLALLPESDEKDSLKESLDSIENNIFYINKIVADLQDYARPLNPHSQQIDLRSIINQSIAASMIPEKITVDYTIDDDANSLMADPDYLKRIVCNLTLNAVQAMPNGGKLTICGFKNKKTGETILTVKDSGVGIPDDVKDKLFTPMFTTKSKGQGFGLSVVKRMTEALGGNVTFKSQTNKGTTFTVRLPPKAKGKSAFS